MTAKIVNALDLDINFDKNPLSGDVTVRTGEEAIRRALKNLMLLKRGEKPFHPEISSGIQDMLFELVDPIMVIEMKSKIADMIRRYEPRIDGAAVTIVDVIDKNEIRITVQFTIRNIQQVYSTTIAMTRLR